MLDVCLIVDVGSFAEICNVSVNSFITFGFAYKLSSHVHISEAGFVWFASVYPSMMF